MPTSRCTGRRRQEVTAAPSSTPRCTSAPSSGCKLETDLRRALERQEFQVLYQPIVSLRDRSVIGFEALLRWQHPERGLRRAGAFLGVAEDTGLITRIDAGCFATACAEARQWQLELPASVSVNISAQSFGQPDIVPAGLRRRCRRPDSSRACLRLEITESTAMADAERARMVLADLKALGIRISLDDFGTGYSSLSYLQRFPVDTLKIDRSFVSGMDRNDGCREIVRTVMNLARSLGLEVIAEGTETADQVRDLERLECRFGQGYYFSAPLPIEQLRGWQLAVQGLTPPCILFRWPSSPSASTRATGVGARASAAPRDGASRSSARPNAGSTSAA